MADTLREGAVKRPRSAVAPLASAQWIPGHTCSRALRHHCSHNLCAGAATIVPPFHPCWWAPNAPMKCLFLFTGADPAASWLTGSGIHLDEKGFIRTGADVRSTDRVPLPLETGVEGIFAVGDVRCGSVKRVGAAIGEGAAVVAQLHTFLARRGSTPASATRA